MQTKRMSAFEAFLNVTVGYVLSVVVGQLVYPLFGIPITLGENAAITLIFMAVGFIRSYLFRRFFTRRTK